MYSQPKKRDRDEKFLSNLMKTFFQGAQPNDKFKRWDFLSHEKNIATTKINSKRIYQVNAKLVSWPKKNFLFFFKKYFFLLIEKGLLRIQKKNFLIEKEDLFLPFDKKGYILNTLRGDGNIMVCSDTAGRMLELAHLLEGVWRHETSGLFSYSIALLNNVSISVIDFAKSQVEWMCDKIVQSFETGRSNPFDFKHIKLCCSLAEVARIAHPSRNKLVLVSLSDMECGHGKNLLLEWCENPKNTVLFTHRPAPNTLASSLLEMAQINNGHPNKKISIEVDYFFTLFLVFKIKQPSQNW